MLEPPQGPLAAEILHTIRGVASLPGLAFDWRDLPRGHGRTVLVVPGYLTGDASTAPLRWFLKGLGYRTQGWRQGLNRGAVGPLAQRVAARIEALEGPVSLIGWSLGGVIAREAARLVPHRVDRVITLGTPIVGGPKATRFAALYRRQGADLDAIETRINQRNAIPIPVPIVAFYSRSDGVVSWQACFDANPENQFRAIEVEGGHYALCLSRGPLKLIAQHLAESVA